MLDPTDVTLAAYQARAQQYIDSGPGRGAGALLGRLATLVPGGRVLEVGSGPGHDAAALETLGLQVRRTDATPAFVERLCAAGYAADLLDVRFGDLGGPWDAVLAQAVLLHVAREQLGGVLARMRTAVRRGGVLACSFKEGDGDGWSSRKLGVPRWFVYWREPQLRALLEESGWTVLDLTHDRGSREPWLVVLARRESASGRAG